MALLRAKYVVKSSRLMFPSRQLLKNFLPQVKDDTTPGSSSSGKTTSSRMWKLALARRLRLLSHQQPL